jgi:hypothetical protein
MLHFWPSSFRLGASAAKIGASGLPSSCSPSLLPVKTLSPALAPRSAAYYDAGMDEVTRFSLEGDNNPANFIDPPEAAQEGIAAVQGAGTPVDRLGSMSPRARWALKCANIHTLEDAASRPDEELLAIPHFGESSLVRLRAWQANPADLPPPAGRFLSETREDRIFVVYAALRGAGHPPQKAGELAVAEVDELAVRLRGGT